ncbi:hypothetical protein ACIOJD_05755 [Streptomyces sp. NPDC088116]|uniref:hypothetical protein n=1 Tax=Streptomyces sp. NPDC088116 TaxID=3365825 RepID=UPI0038300207
MARDSGVEEPGAQGRDGVAGRSGACGQSGVAGQSGASVQAGVVRPVGDRLDSGHLRTRLCGLLQEDDPDRPLDSLETVVVTAFLTKRAPDREIPTPPDAPRTIEGWVTWAARHSSGS